MAEDTYEPPAYLVHAAARLAQAEHAIDPQEVVANALTGLLHVAVGGQEQESRENYLREQWDAADEALARVLALADDLDEQPTSRLHDAAFPKLAARIRAAVDGEAGDPR